MISAARGNWLLDTGPLVALLSADDAAHERCRDWFEAFAGRFLTTEAVLTEAMHLLRRHRGGQDAGLEFIERGGALLVPLTVERLKRCRVLVARYRDVPMDFADASLVALADELDVPRAFTLDRRGFGAYRLSRKRRFALAPES
jgi:uncharacterized protein